MENLLDGKGFVYNEGRRVLGVSTITWPFMLAGVKVAFANVPLPELAVRVNGFLWAAAGLGFFLFLRRVTGNRLVAAAGAGLLLVHSGMLVVSLLAMESSLFTALLFFALLALACNRPVAFGVLAALLALTRPEAVVLLPVALIAWRHDWRRLVVATAAFLPLPVIAVAAGFLYYGSPVPLSIIAKTKLYPVAPGYALSTLLMWLEKHLTGGWFEFLRQIRTTLVIDVLALASLACVLHAPSRRAFGWAAPLIFWSFLALYLAGNPLFFEWYWPPIFAAALATVVSGAAAATRFVEVRPGPPEPSAARKRTALILPAAVLAWLAAVTVAEYSGPAMQMPAQKAREEAVYLRVVAYEAAARQLQTVLAPGDRVEGPEVGSLGYYLRGQYVIDACGLVSPEAIEFLPVPPGQRMGPESGAISVDLVRKTLPEWVVTMPVFAARSLLVSEWFKSNYTVWGAATMPKPCWGSDRILIFRRSARR